MPIGRKYAHQNSKAIFPPILIFPPDIEALKTPVIGITKHPKKNTQCIIIRYLSHFSFLFPGFMESPIKKVDNAIIP